MITFVNRLLGRRTSKQIGALVALAVSSLIARGIVESMIQEDNVTLRLQWARGNYGHRVHCRRNGWSWELVTHPITNPAGPYSTNALDVDIVPVAAWVRCGKEVVIPRLESMSHLELIECIHNLEPSHPVLEWFARQFEKLAKGNVLDNDALRGLLLLGARRYFKTLPNADRLQRTIEPALMTLLRTQAAVSRDAKDDVDEQIVAGRDYAQALVEVLQETHPLEARRAAHACFSQMSG